MFIMPFFGREHFFKNNFSSKLFIRAYSYRNPTEIFLPAISMFILFKLRESVQESMANHSIA